MKTDKDKFLELMKEFDIEVKEKVWGKEINPDEDISIRIDGDGYAGFHTVFEFDKNGKFKSHGAWE